MSTREVYEKKVFDIDFPVQITYEQRNEEGLYFWPHWHEEIEFNYVTEGSAKIVLEQQEYVLEKGSMIIVNTNELHSGYCESTPYKCIVVSFKPQDLIEKIASMNIIFKPMVVNDPQIDFYMEQIFQECEEKKLAYEDNCKALLTQLLIYLSRNYMSETQSDKISKSRKNNLTRLNQVLCYIEEHFGERISNKELADMIYLSEDRFGHLFRKNIGVSPQQYISQLRIEKARQLIQANEHTITEIARMVGFQDYNHFGRQFRRFYGCTPRELQRQGIVTKKK